jgi:hypothetical protein
MDTKIDILLNSEKNINSVNVETYTKIELERETYPITEYNIRNVLSATDVFDAERQQNAIYRIYGKFEYISLLNGLIQDYDDISDFFKPDYTGDSKNIFNSFDFYLVTPYTGYTQISGDTIEYFVDLSGTTEFTERTRLYKRYFKILAGPDEFDLYPMGYSNNVYDEQGYAFNFNVDIDARNLYDNFGFPVTQLFIYAQYNRGESGGSPVYAEAMRYRTWNATTGEQDDDTSFPPVPQTIGEYLKTTTGDKIADLIAYSDTRYYQTQVVPQNFKIQTKWSSTEFLWWEYNPLIPIQLRYLSDDIYRAKSPQINPSTTYLSVTYLPNPTITETFFKSKRQVLTESKAPITNWEAGGGGSFGWNASTGVLTIFGNGNYEIEFETEIYLSDSDKYVGTTIMQVNDGGGWDDVAGTTKSYRINNETLITKITQSFTFGDQVRFVTYRGLNPSKIQETNTIPDYATPIDDRGNFVWRRILPQGISDPITGVGVDYPFVNERRYLFEPIVFAVTPDLSDSTTRAAFSEIWFEFNYGVLNTTPENDLDDIGQPCQ